jgi:hypothetical protein
MANTVTKPNEIWLNGTKFPISGPIYEILQDNNPAMFTIGDPEYKTQRYSSNWSQSDQRGGILIEEMDESVDTDRCWYSTIDTRYSASLVLPRLTTSVSYTRPTLANPTSNTDVAGKWTNETQAYNGSITDYATFTATGAGYGGVLQLNIASTNCKGVRWYIHADTDATITKIKVELYYEAGYHTVYDSAFNESSWYYAMLGSGVTKDITQVQISFSATGAGNVACLSDVDFITSNAGTGTYATVWKTFSGELYHAIGPALMKLNAAGTAFDCIGVFDNTISDLVISTDGYLLVYLTDYNFTYYVNTSGTIGMSNATARYGLNWDSKTWKMNGSGQWFYSTNPSTTAPTWSAGDDSGGLDDLKETPSSLELYTNAVGTEVPYCLCMSGNVYAYDFANTKWVHSGFTVPAFPQLAKGFLSYDGSLLASYGLGIRKYTSGSTATWSFTGLDLNDGLPSSRGGSITKLIAGDTEYYALIDSTYSNATSRSQVLAKTNYGWRVIWVASADNKNMYSGIVSNDYSYRLWFSTTDGIYYIPLQSTALSPLKDSAYTYAASGEHYSPWFDSQRKTYKKTAIQMTLFCSNMSATSTIACYYRINQSGAGYLDTTPTSWTLLGTANSDGVTEMSFGSSAGIEFYDIQFKFVFSRDAGTTTDTPVLNGATMNYFVHSGVRVWEFTINTAEAGLVSSTPQQLHTAIDTIFNTNTLMPFIYRDTTYYVRLSNQVRGYTDAGRNYEGKYPMQVIRP